MSNEEWVQCPNGCGEKLFYKEVSVHVRSICPDRKELCDCGQLVRHRERNKHKLLFCDLRQVQCKYAPQCKWRGIARDLAVHISDTLSTAQKMARVKGDPFIECLERPYTCWHPPLVKPAEDESEDGFKIRWSGCGAVFPFGRRQQHDSRTCPFRMQLCKLGCGRKVIGYEVEQHYGGKPIKFCRDTNEWLDSMCPEREVPCIYIISQPRETALEPGQEDPDEKRNDDLYQRLMAGQDEEPQGPPSSSANRGAAAGKADTPATHPPALSRAPSGGAGGAGGAGGGSGQGEARVPSVSRTPSSQAAGLKRASSMAVDAGDEAEMSGYCPPALRAANDEVFRGMAVRCEAGCPLRFTAKQLKEHQALECPERFVTCKHGCGQLVKSKLMAAHEDDQHDICTDLHLAASDGNLERCKDHVLGRDAARQFRIDCRDEEGNNVIHYAVEGTTQVMQYLIDCKAGVNVTGSEGFTPLMKAAALGKVEMLELLIKNKADVNVKDSIYGWNALHHCCFKRQLDTAKVLVGQRCNLDETDARRGDSALMLALAAEAPEIAELLVNAGADVNTRNSRRVATFYHTFQKKDGKSKAVARGDVAFDYARSDRMRVLTEPNLDQELATVSKGKGLDPLYGSSFKTTNVANRVSPAKQRALGRSLSPERPLQDVARASGNPIL